MTEPRRTVADGTSGIPCTSCRTEYFDCTFKLRTGGKPCCSRCEYTDTHTTKPFSEQLKRAEAFRAALDGADFEDLMSLMGLLRDALEALPRTPAEAVTEWGVKYPSGNVESFGQDEAKARKYAITTTNLRPDLPTLVVTKVYQNWEVAE